MARKHLPQVFYSKESCGTISILKRTSYGFAQDDMRCKTRLIFKT